MKGMTSMNHEFTLAGYVAIALAVLFPVYWFSALWQVLDMTSVMDAIRLDMQHLGPLDALFVLIGLMEIYLYLCLYRILRQMLGGGLSSALALAMMIALAALTATLLFDVTLVFGGLSKGARDSLMIVGVVTFLVSEVDPIAWTGFLSR